MKHCYVTTPIYYLNDVPHMGHAYTNVIADSIARFARFLDHKVHFLTGTDEHGKKIAKAALAKGVTYRQMIDDLSKKFLLLAENLDCTHNDFIRTSELRHKEAVHKFWHNIEKDIYLGKYAGWYSMRDEAYYSDNEVVDGYAPTGSRVEWIEEESYFFRLSNFSERLLSFYEKNPGFIEPHFRYNEVKQFVAEGLRDLSISRVMSQVMCGIEVPYDKNHVIYVWIDALVNYISALGFAKNDSELFHAFWGAETNIIHVLGKDIIRFHGVFWPALLISCGLRLPTKLLVHGWWTNNGSKISKSLGNVICPNYLIEKFGLDAVRYFLLSDINVGNDGDFSEARLIAKVNSDLCDNIGNLVNRVCGMTARYFNGVVPNAACDSELQLLLDSFTEKCSNTSPVRAQSVLHEVIYFSNAVNARISNAKPWEMRKDIAMKGALESLLYGALESIKRIGIILKVFMPDYSSRLLSVFEEDVQFGVYLTSGKNISERCIVMQKIDI